jgi:hypothetical protein
MVVETLQGSVISLILQQPKRKAQTVETVRALIKIKNMSRK